METVSLSSSAISQVSYNSDTKEMHITFAQGRTYIFCGVPRHIFEGLTTAASAGTYYNSYIRDRYQC